MFKAINQWHLFNNDIHFENPVIFQSFTFDVQVPKIFSISLHTSKIIQVDFGTQTDLSQSLVVAAFDLATNLSTLDLVGYKSILILGAGFWFMGILATLW